MHQLTVGDSLAKSVTGTTVYLLVVFLLHDERIAETRGKNMDTILNMIENIDTVRTQTREGAKITLRSQHC